MSKDIQGGVPNYGWDVTDSGTDSDGIVAITPPSFRIEEETTTAADRIDAGEAIHDVVSDVARRAATNAACETARRLLCFLSDSRNPALKIDQLLWAGQFLSLMENQDGVTLAKKHGISKQAFQQGAEKIRLTLGLPKMAKQRDEGASVEMSACNKRRDAKPPKDIADRQYVG